jgi:hypothetical protein
MASRKELSEGVGQRYRESSGTDKEKIRVGGGDLKEADEGRS